ncbi:MAG: hypothetical protein AAFO07_07610 [Bacteroidota bacterium]
MSKQVITFNNSIKPIIFRATINYIVSFIVLITLLSCTTEEFPENQIFPKVENAEWAYFDIPFTTNIIKRGKYKNDLKFGNWTYEITNTENSKKIDWKLFSNNRLKLIIKDDWKVDTSNNNRLFFSITKDSTGYFVVLERMLPDYDPIDYLSELYEFSLNDTSETLISRKARLLVTSKQENAITYDFNFNNGKIKSSALGFIFKKENKIFEIVFRQEVQSETDKLWGKVVFTELINNIIIDNTRVALSFDKYEKIEDIDFD